MSTEARHLPTFRANEERLAWLTETCRELNMRFAGKVMAERNAGERPPACSVRLTGDGLFATFGVVDATYFWTFDNGESCHYAKDKHVMRRLLTFELRSALSRGAVR